MPIRRATTGSTAANTRTRVTRRRAPRYASDAEIRVLVHDNPHRIGSGRHRRWPKYRTGMTVAEALRSGFNRANLWHSVQDIAIR